MSSLLLPGNIRRSHVAPASDLDYGIFTQGDIRGAWAFDNGVGTLVQDVSPVGLNATTSGSPVWGRDPDGGYLTFLAASSQFASVPDTPALNPTAAIGIWADFYVDALPGAGVIAGIVTKQNGGPVTNPPYFLAIDNTGANPLFSATLVSGADNTTQFNQKSTTIVQAGQRYQVGFRYDGLEMRMFVNGRTDKNTSTVPPSIAVSTGNLHFGQGKSGSSRFFSGKIYSVIVAGYGLSTGEMLQLSYEPACWRMGELLWTLDTYIPPPLATFPDGLHLLDSETLPADWITFQDGVHLLDSETAAGAVVPPAGGAKGLLYADGFQGSGGTKGILNADGFQGF